MDDGGGVYLLSSSVTILRTLFTSNIARSTEEYIADGGCLDSRDDSNV